MSSQEVENENMEHAEVNKVITIKCSQNTGPEGLDVLWSDDSKEND